MIIKQEKIDEIKTAINENMVDFHNYEFRTYIEDYKSYIWDVSERLKTKEYRQMNMSYPLAFMMVDTVYWTIFDFDYQLKLKNKNLERACIDAYDFKSYWKQTLWMTSKEWLITGTGIMRDYTFYEEWTYEAFGDEINYEIKSPTMEYISVFNVMYDRMKWLNDSNYKIVRQFLSESDISKRVIWNIIDKETKKKVINEIRKYKDSENNAFSMYNYEAIKWLLFSTEFIDSVTDKKNRVKKTYSTNVNSVTNCDELNFNRWEGFKLWITTSPYYNNFNHKYEVVEFIEWNQKHLFINGNYILTSKINPNIYNIVAVEFNKIPWSGKSIWIPRIIKDLSESSNGLMNMFLDSLKLANTMIFKKNKWLQWKNAKIKIESWIVLDWDISRVNLWGWDFSWMNWVQALQAIAQSTLGINQMIMWGDGRVQRIAGAFDFAFSQYKSRLTPFTDSIDIAMIKVVKWWISQFLYIYSEAELLNLYDIKIKKITNEWVVTDIMIDDDSMKEILNENNIAFKFDSMYNLKKDADKKLAMDIFQLAQQYNNSKIDWEAFIKLLSWDQNVKLEDVLWIKSDTEFKSDDELDDINDIDLDNLLKEDNTEEINSTDINDTLDEEEDNTEDINTEELLLNNIL